MEKHVAIGMWNTLRDRLQARLDEEPKRAPIGFKTALLWMRDMERAAEESALADPVAAGLVDAPPCPKCGTGPVASLAGLDGKRIEVCRCGCSLYGDPSAWAGIAGDLSGRLELIRRFIDNNAPGLSSLMRTYLRAVADGKVIGQKMTTTKPKSPADALANEVRRFINARMSYDTRLGDLQSALDEYLASRA